METLSFALICKLIILMPLIIGSQDGSVFHFLRLTAGNLETIIGELEAFGESELRRVLSADVDAGEPMVPHIPPFSVYKSQSKVPDRYHGFYGREPVSVPAPPPEPGMDRGARDCGVDLLGFEDRSHLERLKRHLHLLGRFYLSPVVSTVLRN